MKGKSGKDELGHSLHPHRSQMCLGIFVQRAGEHLCRIPMPGARAPYVWLTAHDVDRLVKETPQRGARLRRLSMRCCDRSRSTQGDRSAQRGLKAPAARPPTYPPTSSSSGREPPDPSPAQPKGRAVPQQLRGPPTGWAGPGMPGVPWGSGVVLAPLGPRPSRRLSQGCLHQCSPTALPGTGSPRRSRGRVAAGSRHPLPPVSPTLPEPYAASTSTCRSAAQGRCQLYRDLNPFSSRNFCFWRGKKSLKEAAPCPCRPARAGLRLPGFLPWGILPLGSARLPRSQPSSKTAAAPDCKKFSLL